MTDKNESVRRRWIADKLEQVCSGKKILDAGAGELQYKKYCKHLEYVSQDFCEYSGVGNEKGLQTGEWDTSKIDIVSDITDIPCADESFDAVLCSEVLEHVPYPQAAIKELARVLKCGGELILTAPFCSLTHFAPYHFYTGFNQYFYKRILDDAGIELKEMTSYGDYYAYMQQELLRLPSIAERYNSHGLDRKSIKQIDRLCRKLEDLNAEANKSSELLCFGYMIYGIKNK